MLRYILTICAHCGKAVYRNAEVCPICGSSLIRDETPEIEEDEEPVAA